MVSLLGQREYHKNKQIRADLRCSFYYPHFAISLGEIRLPLYKKAIKCVIYLERILSKRLRFLKIFGSLRRINFNYLKTHWYGTLHCLPNLAKQIYAKVTKHAAPSSEPMVRSAPWSPKGKTRKTVDKSHKTGETMTHSAGEKGEMMLQEAQCSTGLKENFLLWDKQGDYSLACVFQIMIFGMPLTLLICRAWSWILTNWSTYKPLFGNQ